MAGAYDPLRRMLLLGALVATVVFLMAPAARADEASAAVAEATGAAIADQAQPANVNVSVRVDSPGENGPVAQVNSAGASAAGGVSASAGSAQAGPANVNVSVRVDSPGDDGAVTQTNTSGAAAAGGGQAAAAGTAASSEGEASAPAATASRRPPRHRPRRPPRGPARGPGGRCGARAAGGPQSAPTRRESDTRLRSVASVSGDSVLRPGVSASADRASAPAGVSASPAAASARPPRAPPVTARVPPGPTPRRAAASAPGVPDTWTWVWNWTGACLNAPASTPRAGWNWVWNWTCSDGGQPTTTASPTSAPPGYDATPVAVVDWPATPAADAPVPVPATRHASPRAASSTGGTAPAPRRPPAPAAGAVDAQQLFSSFTPSGVAHPLAPRVHRVSPAARAKPMRERGRRGGAGGGGSHSPFDPDPSSPPPVASSASGGAPGFVLLLTMALMAAVSLLDPAGWSMRVATAARTGLDRIVRRIDRPG